MKLSVFDKIKKIKVSEWNLNPENCKLKTIKLDEIPFKEGDKFFIANFRVDKPRCKIIKIKANGNVIIEIPKLQIISMEIKPSNLNIIE